MPSPQLSRRALLAASSVGIAGTACCAEIADRFREHPVTWQTDVADRYLCSPFAMVDGRLLAMGENHLTALDPASGERLWRSRFYEHAADGPVVAEGVAVVGDERRAGYGADGDELWSRETDHHFSPHDVLADGAIVGSLTGDAPTLLTIDPADGSRRWAYALPEPSPQGHVTDAVAVEAGVVATRFDGRLSAVDADGTDRWRASNDWDGHGPGRPTLAAGPGVVVAANAAVAGVDAATGERRWRHVLPDYAAGVAIVDGVAHVAVGSDDMKVDSWDAPGGVLAFDLADGTERWRTRLSGRAGPPTVDGDTVWVGTGDGRLVALDVDSGERRWRRSVGERVETAPLVTGGRVFVGVGTPAAGDACTLVAVRR
ncbi:PQQ-binding-like beta-propeller repeat protein [Halorarum halophilum]|uniref:PQQ-binding-like beta-propeller repeat protein n=1 Tax=Halorarum halophilum TaxID=2743090 RepID=A0A7D5GWU8_9EURY|nr:PQQ-binding-like beta-propeller repeat protein [Halobaculum halophilum]QLG27229.1 PQQ-binding-like beta-propeller repeat protein [Halobaculum halophilum]